MEQNQTQSVDPNAELQSVINAQDQAPIVLPRRRRKRLFVILAAVGVIIVIAAATLPGRSTDSATQTTEVTPAQLKLRDCLTAKHVNSDDWATYQKAAMDCQAEQK